MITGVLFFASLVLGSQVPLSTFQLTSLIIGVCAFIFTTYPYIKIFYIRVIELPEYEGEQPTTFYFNALSNRRRRMTLLYMNNNNREVDIRELAEEIAADENNITKSELRSAQIKRVYTALQQSHLPQLEKASIIHFNKNKGFIELTKQGKKLTNMLGLFAEHFEPRLSDNSRRLQDDLFNGIRNVRRRYVLHYLSNSKNNKHNVNDMAEQIAAWELDCTVSGVTSEDRQRVYGSLYKTHLDLLDDIRLVNWYEDTGSVEITNDGEIISEWISLIEGKEDFPLSDTSAKEQY